MTRKFYLVEGIPTEGDKFAQVDVQIEDAAANARLHVRLTTAIENVIAFHLERKKGEKK